MESSLKQDLYFCPFRLTHHLMNMTARLRHICSLLPKLPEGKLWLYLLMVFTAFLYACNPSSKLPEGKYLLVKNDIKVKGKGVGSSQLKGYLVQPENKKFLGVFDLNLWIYNQTAGGKSTGFKRWLRRSAGEPPSIYNAPDVLISQRQMKKYLENKGFFNAEIANKTRYKKKKTRVTYEVELKKPYRIRNYFKYSSDDTIRRIVLEDATNSLIKKGNRYDFYVLEKERSRLNKMLRNKGYFFISEDFISFQIDSSLNSHELDISMIISQPDGRPASDSLIVDKLFRKRFRINDIFIYPQLDPLHSNRNYRDTLEYVRMHYRHKGDTLGVYRFLYSQKPIVRSKTLVPSIYFGYRDFYSEFDVDKTSTALRTLPIFRYVQVSFDTLPGTLAAPPGVIGQLNCHIDMAKAKRNSFLIETEATNSAGMLGLAGNLVLKNKNIFHGAEVFSIRLKGALEMQQSLDQAEEQKDFFFFNTVETGIEASLYFPRFLGPISPQRFPRYFRPRTSVLTGLNYQRRPDYERTIAKASLGYEWNQNQQVTHYLFPLEVNAVKIFPSEEFLERLEEIDNPRLTSQYSDHMIFALKYSYVKNTQQRGSFSNFHYMRFNFESSGNLLYAIDEAIKLDKNADGNYTLLGIRYAQYLRFDTDLRQYFYLDRNNQLAMRAIFGIGVPYANSNSLPFEKGFYGGGANGMRGWELKTLGPGIYQAAGANKYEVMGDIKLEANVEYRFPIYSALKGALFTDIGNIWLLHSSDVYPGGEFRFDDFYKEFAIDAGLGFRFDFEFFVIRVDGALPIKDPGAEDQWVYKKARISDVMWNFGIGYPF